MPSRTTTLTTALGLLASGVAAPTIALASSDAVVAAGTADSSLTLLDVAVAGRTLSAATVGLRSSTVGGPSSAVTVTPISLDGTPYGRQTLTPGKASTLLPAVDSRTLVPGGPVGLVSPALELLPGTGGPSSSRVRSGSLGKVDVLGLPLQLDGTVSLGSAVNDGAALGEKALVVEGLALPSLADLLARLGLDLTALPPSTLKSLTDRLGLTDASITDAQAVLDAALGPLKGRLATATSDIAKGDAGVEAALKQVQAATAALAPVIGRLETARADVAAALGGSAPGAAKLLGLPPLLPTTTTSTAPTTTTSGLLGPVAGILGPLAPIVDGVAAPLAPVLQPVAPVVDTVTAPLAPVLQPVVPVVDTVTAPLAPVLQPVVDGVVTPVVGGVVTPIVTPVVDGVVTPVVTPVVDQVLTPVLDGVGQLPAVLPLPLPELPALIPTTLQELLDVHATAQKAYEAALGTVQQAQQALAAAQAVLKTATDALDAVLALVKPQLDALVKAVVGKLDATPLLSLDRLSLVTRASSTGAGAGQQKAEVLDGTVVGLEVLGTDVLQQVLGTDRVSLRGLDAKVNDAIGALTGTVSSVLSNVPGLPMLSVPTPKVELLATSSGTGVKDGFGNATTLVRAVSVSLPAITLPTSAALPKTLVKGRSALVAGTGTTPITIAVGTLADAASFRAGAAAAPAPTATPAAPTTPGTGPGSTPGTGTPGSTPTVPGGSNPVSGLDPVTGLPVAAPVAGAPTSAPDRTPVTGPDGTPVDGPDAAPTGPGGITPLAGPAPVPASLPRTGLPVGAGALGALLAAAGLLVLRRLPARD